MKKTLRMLSLLLALILIVTCFVACGDPVTPDPDPSCTSHVDANKDGKCDKCGESVAVDPGQKTVRRLAVDTKPTKDFYTKGETLSLEGGKITVTYTDGSTEVVDMADPMFEMRNPPNMDAIGNKTVTLYLKGSDSIKASFSIKVADESFNVTYNYGYEGKANDVEAVVKGNKAEEKQPTREGYTFVNWYTEADFITVYDFETKISGDLNLYAFWTKNGATYYDVTFDYDYYGDKVQTYVYKVESGKALPTPATPTRFGYSFSKWTLNGSDYNFATPVTGNITIKATWTKTISGEQTYVFEAEDTDLTGKTGPAISGTSQEKGLIVTSPAGKECSNDRFVSFMYQRDNSVEFFVACDEDITVTLYARLSAEYGEDYTYNKENYGINVNEVPIDYPNIEMKNIPVSADPASGLDCLVFRDFFIGNVSLKKGKNVIQLITKNNDAYEGTTMVAHAPIIDCIKIKTTAVVTWDANFNLPFPGNY